MEPLLEIPEGDGSVTRPQTMSETATVSTSDNVTTKRRPMIIAAEEDSDDESEITGPPPQNNGNGMIESNSYSTIGDSQFSHLNATQHSDSNHNGLASQRDLNMPANEFAEGCKLLQAAALGNKMTMDVILQKRPRFVNFRDYDRRTAMHVAASEGHLEICKYLVQKGARINRSDRWGGSPLDDSSRHRHKDVIQYLRTLGATTGSASKATNFIKAAAEGDVDEVEMLLISGEVDVNEGDYDKRTAIHLAAGEGNTEIVRLLCKYKANVNIEDRWGNRPLDDALRGKNDDCAAVLKENGAARGIGKQDLGDSVSRRREIANLQVKFSELEMVDKIGKGSFGEIYRCRWRDIMVAAKCIRTAKVQKDWAIKQALHQLDDGADVDDVISEIDGMELAEADKKKALADFRTEISILKSLRHPNIVLLLAYSTTEDLEVMISELMRCSLLDIFKAHIINGTKMKMKDKLAYAVQLAQGMYYLHTCKPPIIHRDLKPANLLIDHSGVLKVADFGLSKVRPDKNRNEKGDTFMMTGETGSYRFMAPEIYHHLDYNETVDVYSYAMILFYLLDGKPPWPTMNGLVAARKAADEGERPTIPRSWDQRLQQLLQDCWDENPAARPPFQRILLILRQHSRMMFPTESSENMQASNPVSVVQRSSRRLQAMEKGSCAAGGGGCGCSIM